jgi:hypothetical protein
MSENPFEPPKSGFGKPPLDRDPGSPLKAILLGAATDIVGTMLLGIVLGIAYALFLATQGLSDTEIEITLQNIDRTSAFGLLAMAGGFAMSVLGGYVCARIANVTSYTAVGITAMISFAYGTYMGSGEDEWPTLLALNLTTVVAVFVGGWWHVRRLQLPS